ncbi:adenylate kinase family protein [Haloferax volcanii]|uniref:Putative adenylate kinase n=3 Tax=Haloferax volcanii TaxID=2246 RepID=D4GXD8_HALVD|nr:MULTISPECIES: adenylate kinase family protein [Haloferax]ADE03705.1 putative adenylate kinase [Haloferax volcanii DS2]ELK46103.1 putative nucleotide kinase [Haloferax sp. BAB-2207]ELY28018.1 putative nucleotide kinase [Haloferax volcanii DS2]MBS8117735.1 adenylate kinase family protein [Haloferax volcanii]MBS8122747.1 adenylate kinase family protein [Haloferax volcanii]
MRVVVTGTPGTGKTTATERVAADLDLDVVHLNRLVKDEGLWTERDDERDTLVVDLDAARDELGDWDGIVESHLAHHFEADRVVVLRCRPDVLEQRLLDRGEAEAKARENRESEALDVILGEAVEFHGEESVYEIDTTDRDPDAVADDIAAVVAGEREPSAGTVDFIDYL